MISGDPDNDSRRYDDPFLRIVELYALAAIGALDPEDRARMKELTPELQRIYGLDVGWKKIVEQVMEFGSGAEEEVRTLWEEWKEQERTGGPPAFARDFADRYFPDQEE